MEDHKMIFTYHSLALIVLMIINVLFFKAIKSEVYTVGGEEQWNTEANFDSWSHQYNFSVGDVLVFKYTKGQHNVFEVTRDTYQSCDASTGVLAQYETGNDQVKLTEAKKYWFICNVAGHCLGGMRFTIDVKKANSSKTNSTDSDAPTPDSDTPTPPVEPTSSCVSYAFQRWNAGIYILSCVILLFKLY